MNLILHKKIEVFPTRRGQLLSSEPPFSLLFLMSSLPAGFPLACFRTSKLAGAKTTRSLRLCRREAGMERNETVDFGNLFALILFA